MGSSVIVGMIQREKRKDLFTATSTNGATIGIHHFYFQCKTPLATLFSVFTSNFGLSIPSCFLTLSM